MSRIKTNRLESTLIKREEIHEATEESLAEECCTQLAFHPASISGAGKLKGSLNLANTEELARKLLEQSAEPSP